MPGKIFGYNVDGAIDLFWFWLIWQVCRSCGPGQFSRPCLLVGVKRTRICDWMGRFDERKGVTVSCLLLQTLEDTCLIEMLLRLGSFYNIQQNN